MKKILNSLIMFLTLISICFVSTACDMGSHTETENVLYTDFEDKLYFKGSLYSLSPSFLNTTFYFPILSKKKVNDIENVEFYCGDSKINGTVTVIPDTRDDKIINENLYLNVVEFQLNIQNIEGIQISQINLEADGIEAKYEVEIDLHYYYLNPQYNLTTQGDMLFEYEGNSCSLIYGYSSLTSVSKFNSLESMVEGIDIIQLHLANGDVDEVIEGQLPWQFDEIKNDGTNSLAYKSNVLKIECDFSEIRQQAVFFKDAFKANLSIGEERVEILLPDVASNSLIELYVELCKGIQK